MHCVFSFKYRLSGLKYSCVLKTKYLRFMVGVISSFQKWRSGQYLKRPFNLDAVTENQVSLILPWEIFSLKILHCMQFNILSGYLIYLLKFLTIHPASCIFHISKISWYLLFFPK